MDIFENGILPEVRLEIYAALSYLIKSYLFKAKVINTLDKELSETNIDYTPVILMEMYSVFNYRDIISKENTVFDFSIYDLLELVKERMSSRFHLEDIDHVAFELLMHTASRTKDGSHRFYTIALMDAETVDLEIKHLLLESSRKAQSFNKFNYPTKSITAKYIEGKMSTLEYLRILVEDNKKGNFMMNSIFNSLDQEIQDLISDTPLSYNYTKYINTPPIFNEEGFILKGEIKRVPGIHRYVNMVVEFPNSSIIQSSSEKLDRAWVSSGIFKDDITGYISVTEMTYIYRDEESIDYLDALASLTKSDVDIIKDAKHSLKSI